MQVYANFNMLGLLALGALAWGFLRVLDAPRGAIRALPLVLILIALSTQILLPAEAPFRQSVGGFLRFGVFAGLLAVPVLGYRAILRRMRARNAPPAPPPKTGYVLIEEDDLLVRDTRAKIAAEAGDAAAPEAETFSIAYRDPSGEILGTVQGAIGRGLLDIRGLFVDPRARGQAIGSGLLGELEAAAVARGATRACVTTCDARSEGLYAARGYGEYGRLSYPEGPTRIHMVKDLT